MSRSPTTVWSPQPGPQTWLVTCPVRDIFFGGARGGGKTDGLMGDWLSHAGRYGAAARGIWFRRSMPELRDVLVRMRAVFVPLGAVYGATEKVWRFPNGAELWLAYLERDADAARYQGHNYSWIAIDEAGTWPSSDAVDTIRGSLRSAAGVPTRFIATGNPGGPGHGWLKARYVDPGPPLQPFIDQYGIERVFIPSRLEDNRILQKNDPAYEQQLVAATLGRPWLYEAWRKGDWNATPEGAMVRVEWMRHRYRLPSNAALLEAFVATMDAVTLSIDVAEKPGASNDATSWTVWGRKGGAHHLLHARRAQVAFPELRRDTKAIAAEWNPRRVLIEDKSSGTPLIQDLRPDRDWRWPIIAKIPKDKKEVRFSRTLGFWESGLVLLPEPGPHVPWLAPYVHEVSLFPLQMGTPGTDDQCDSTSQYLEDAHLHGSSAASLFRWS